MTTAIMESTLAIEPWAPRPRPHRGTNEDTAERVSPVATKSLIEVVNDILGYDLQKTMLMAEGYREFAQEAFVMAESTVEAGIEAWDSAEEAASPDDT